MSKVFMRISFALGGAYFALGGILWPEIFWLIWQKTFQISWQHRLGHFAPRQVPPQWHKYVQFQI
jgi:hypothetical protein